MTSPVLGLDLGTTNTVAAWCDDTGEVHVVRVGDRGRSLPSVVCFHGSRDKVLVGDAARKLVADDPKNTVFGSKRFLGRRFLSDYVGRNRGRFLFHLVEGYDGMTAVEIRGERVSLEEVALHIVRRMLELANEEAGLTFETCVVTCPAHFHHRQRHALRRIIEAAGLEVQAMVNEPTAAAVGSAASRGDSSVVLVYDLGGGTFDTTLMRVNKGIVEVLGTGGDAFLGGSEFDAALVDLVVNRFFEVHGADLRDNPILLQRLAYAVENAKIELSTSESAAVHVPAAHMTGDGFVDLDDTLTRALVESACDPLIERTIGIAEQTVRNAGLSPQDVDQVLLVGGQTRMPRLRQRVREIFPAHVDAAFDADAGVAGGAALIGSGEGMLLDVLSVPVCVMVPGGGPSVAFDKNSSLPASSRLPVPRPPSGAPLPVIVYEAMEATAIDRDVLGALRVDPEWLAAHDGELNLACELSASYELRFAIECAGERQSLPLSEPPGAKPPAELRPPPVTVQDPVEPRVEATLPVIVQRAEGLPARAKTVFLSNTSVYVADDQPPAPGGEVALVFNREGTPWRVTAKVSFARAATTTSSDGLPAGFEADWIFDDDQMAEELERFVSALETAGGVREDTAAAYSEAESEEASVVAPQEGSSTALRTFVVRVQENALYEAFRVPPTAPVELIDEAAANLRRTIELLRTSASERSQRKLIAVERVLERVHNLLRDPRRRLAYDFKEGHELVEHRLAAPDQHGVNDPALLKEVWGRVHPDRVEQAGLLRGRASRALQSRDLRGAIAFATEAAELDPFDTATREFIAMLKQSQG